MTAQGALPCFVGTASDKMHTLSSKRLRQATFAQNNEQLGKFAFAHNHVEPKP